ncbi:AmmeMemoRadiSam system protein B [Salininema proteolyticum]|uniref:AmmeMemoRadiSam system protein B n=1 Tax=Salininema proteolyticum TaxID=1607685 RepID=A0ABV8U146_9ACTN
MTETIAFRPPAVAGLFYPAKPEPLRATVRTLLDGVTVPEDDGPLAEAYIVPHAGLRFSGAVAAESYARIARHAAEVDHVIILGPSHQYPLRGAAASPAATWVTPLGGMTLAPTEAVAAQSEPHANEHSLEIQLPFLQSILPSTATITPVAVGMSGTDDTADLIERLVADSPSDRPLVLCSTDLSHYHDIDTATSLDQETAEAILALEPERIPVERACGIFALRGLLAWAKRTGLAARRLRLGTSADTSGSPDRVVGYPAFAFERADARNR